MERVAQLLSAREYRRALVRLWVLGSDRAVLNRWEQAKRGGVLFPSHVMWDAASGKALRTLQGHQGGVNSVAWGPDGKTLASPGGDNTVRVWADGGQQLCMEAAEMPRMSPDALTLANARRPPGPRPATNWYSLDFRQDPRGLWRGEGPILDTLLYRDMGEPPQPWPWLPRDWRARDVPQLKAPD